MGTRESTRAAQARPRKLFLPVGQEFADIIKRLEAAQAVITTAASALAAQGADIDNDVALTIRMHVGAVLFDEVERLKAIAEGTELQGFRVVKAVRQ